MIFSIHFWCFWSEMCFFYFKITLLFRIYLKIKSADVYLCTNKSVKFCYGKSQHQQTNKTLPFHLHGPQTSVQYVSSFDFVTVWPIGGPSVMSGSSQFNQCGLTILSLSFAVNSKAGGGGGLCEWGSFIFHLLIQEFQNNGQMTEAKGNAVIVESWKVRRRHWKPGEV